MKYRPKPTFFSFMLFLVIAGLFWAGELQAQKNRSYHQDPKSRIVSWADWQTLACERCEATKKTDCGTCNAGRKKLPAKCGECRGKKKADCRDCFGAGNYQDPHLVVRCTRCEARGAFNCVNCGGAGHIMYRGGEKGAKCKVCAKKCMVKCSVCKGKRFLKLLQPEGTSFSQANRAQLAALSARIKPVFDKLEGFTDNKNRESQKPDDRRAIFREENYQAVMKKVIELFPEWKSEVKNVKSWSKKMLKHKEIPDYKKRLHNLRYLSASYAQNFLRYQMGVLRDCNRVFDENKRIAELMRRRKEKAGGGQK